MSFEPTTTCLNNNNGFGIGKTFPGYFGNGTDHPKNTGFGNGFTKTDVLDNGLYGWSDEKEVEPKVEPSKPKEKKSASDRPDPVNMFR